MHVLAIYAVNQHLSELMAEAEASRLARRANPKRGLRARVSSLFSGSRPAPAPATKAYANS